MDTFAFDKFWATVAPLESSGNSSFVAPHYTTFFNMTQPKFLSTVPRDNVYRQFASLWFITVTPLRLLLMVTVDVRSHSLLCVCLVVILFRLWSNVFEPSQVPCKPNSQGNYIDYVFVATNGRIHCTLVSCRSSRVLKVVSRPREIWMVVYCLPISSFSRLHRLFDLLDSSRFTPPARLQNTS